jgi:hypothetical protein
VVPNCENIAFQVYVFTTGLSLGRMNAIMLMLNDVCDFYYRTWNNTRLEISLLNNVVCYGVYEHALFGVLCMSHRVLDLVLNIIILLRKHLQSVISTGGLFPVGVDRHCRSFVLFWKSKRNEADWFEEDRSVIKA